jgi:peptidoglycan/LPS O-acetylase OafA/YrhL
MPYNPPEMGMSASDKVGFAVGWGTLSLINAAILFIPRHANASDTHGMGEAAALMFVYPGLLALLASGCVIAMIRSRSWRPLLVLPLSICISAVLVFALVSLDPDLPGSFAAFLLLAGAPVIAIPLAVLVYKRLLRADFHKEPNDEA